MRGRRLGGVWLSACLLGRRFASSLWTWFYYKDWVSIVFFFFLYEEMTSGE